MQNNFPTSLTVLQLNCQKKAAVNNEVDKFINDGRADIILLQEPAQIKGKIKNISRDNNIFVGTENDEKVRTCIITSPGLKAFKLNQFSNRDQTTIILQTGIINERIVFSSIYMPHDSQNSPPEQITKDLINHCLRNNLKLVICTDCNSHNEIWGSSDNNRRGEDLLDYIVTTELEICNLGNTPTFVNAIRGEVLDITLASQNVFENILNWKVLNTDMMSDHRPITFNVNIETTQDESKYRNVRTTNWDKFRSQLREELIGIDDNAGLNEQTDKLNTAINRAYIGSCREKNRKRRQKPDWWTNELTELKSRAFSQ